MLIFGSRSRTKLLATLSYVCDRCGVHAAHQLIHLVRWFTLFFLPVFPFGGGRYLDTCVNCGRTIEVEKAQALSAAANATTHSA